MTWWVHVRDGERGSSLTIVTLLRSDNSLLNSIAERSINLRTNLSKRGNVCFIGPPNPSEKLSRRAYFLVAFPSI